MALRQIREMGDEVLTKVSKVVKEVTPRTLALIEDMLDTMYETGGVGLAAPQIGILRRIAVIDVGEGKIELINPEVVKTSGEQTGEEGCLSCPGTWGEVTRPMKVTVKAQDRFGNEFKVKGNELLARALCHEIDHLDGVLFVDKVEKTEE